MRDADSLRHNATRAEHDQVNGDGLLSDMPMKSFSLQITKKSTDRWQ
jgi:hypothetical protein